MSNNEDVVTESPETESPDTEAVVTGKGTPPPVVTGDKIDQFRAAVQEMKLKTGKTRGDLIRQVIGGLLMVGGFVAGLILYEQSLSQSSALNLASEEILAVTMLGVIVIGAALFVSASLSRFLRFWMLRNLYEGQAHIDQLVEGLGSGPK